MVRPDVMYESENSIVELPQYRVGIIFAGSAIFWNGAASLGQTNEQTWIRHDKFIDSGLRGHIQPMLDPQHSSHHSRRADRPRCIHLVGIFVRCAGEYICPLDITLEKIGART